MQSCPESLGAMLEYLYSETSRSRPTKMSSPGGRLRELNEKFASLDPCIKRFFHIKSQFQENFLVLTIETFPSLVLPKVYLGYI